MRAQGLGFEFGVELNGDVPGVPRQLDDFDELAVERPSDDFQAAIAQGLFVEAIELIAVAVAFLDDLFAIEPKRQGVWREAARVTAQTHRSAQVVNAEEVS